MIRTLKPCLAGLMLLGLATGACAQSVSAAWPQSVVAAMQDAGYRATLAVDSYGDPMIESAAGGKEFTVFFYGCDSQGAACRDLQFSSGFDLATGISPAAVNSWNREKLLGRAYVDEEGDPFLQHFVAGVDGVSREGFVWLLEHWDLALGEFSAFVDW